jgi:hypothetical protein
MIANQSFGFGGRSDSKCETTAEHPIMPTSTGLHPLGTDDWPLDPGIIVLVELIAREAVRISLKNESGDRADEENSARIAS